MRLISRLRPAVALCLVASAAVACGGPSHDTGTLGAAREAVLAVESTTTVTSAATGSTTAPPVNPPVSQAAAPAAVAPVAAATSGTTSIDTVLEQVDSLLRAVDTVLADTSDAG